MSKSSRDPVRTEAQPLHKVAESTVNARDHLPLAQRSYIKRLVEETLAFVPAPWPRRNPDDNAGAVGNDRNQAHRGFDRSEVPRQWIPYFRRLRGALSDFNLAPRLELMEECTPEGRYALAILRLACRIGWAEEVFRRQRQAGQLAEQLEGEARAALEEAARVNVVSYSDLFDMLANMLPMDPTDFDRVVGNIRRITEAAGRGVAGDRRTFRRF